MRKLSEYFRNFISGEGGAVSVIVVVAMTLLLGCAALAVDLGSGYHAKISLQTAVDNSALAAGTMLSVNRSDTSELEAKAIEYMELNGIDTEGLALISSSSERKVYKSDDLQIIFDYELEGNGYTIWDTVRITAHKDIQYGFAKAIGTEEGRVSATARVTSVSEPVRATINAISIYIEQDDFEDQVDRSNIKLGDEFTITITSSGAVNKNLRNNATYSMGILHIVPFGSESQYCLSNTDGWASSTKGDPIFFMKGYWQYSYTGSGSSLRVSDNTRIGLAVGDVRAIEDSNQIYSNAYYCMKWRVDTCQGGCTASQLPSVASALQSGWTEMEACPSGCCAEKHNNTCPRVALLPVVSVGYGYYTNEKGTSTYGKVGTVQYFVPIYIKSVAQSSKGCVITAQYIDGYRERDVSDTPDTSTQAITSVNEFTAGTSVLQLTE